MKYLVDQKRYLINAILAARDPKVPMYKHLREWQDLNDPFKAQIIQAAMGQAYKAKPIPNRTLRHWMKQL